MHRAACRRLDGQDSGSPGTDAEGQFLPETYRFPSGTTDLELLRQAHAALVRELESAWASRDPRCRCSNADELLIVASIVQKESGVPQELPKIAGLYLHRLRIGMRLQADPTVIYGLGRALRRRRCTRSICATDGPYNTYTRAGLPPTPIALAGAAAIRCRPPIPRTPMRYISSPPRGTTAAMYFRRRWRSKTRRSRATWRICAKGGRRGSNEAGRNDEHGSAGRECS